MGLGDFRALGLARVQRVLKLPIRFPPGQARTPLVKQMVGSLFEAQIHQPMREPVEGNGLTPASLNVCFSTTNRNLEVQVVGHRIGR